MYTPEQQPPFKDYPPPDVRPEGWPELGTAMVPDGERERTRGWTPDEVLERIRRDPGQLWPYVLQWLVEHPGTRVNPTARMTAPEAARLMLAARPQRARPPRDGAWRLLRAPGMRADELDTRAPFPRPGQPRRFAVGTEPLPGAPYGTPWGGMHPGMEGVIWVDSGAGVDTTPAQVTVGRLAGTDAPAQQQPSVSHVPPAARQPLAAWRADPNPANTAAVNAATDGPEASTWRLEAAGWVNAWQTLVRDREISRAVDHLKPALLDGDPLIATTLRAALIDVPPERDMTTWYRMGTDPAAMAGLRADLARRLHIVHADRGTPMAERVAEDVLLERIYASPRTGVGHIDPELAARFDPSSYGFYTQEVVEEYARTGWRRQAEIDEHFDRLRTWKQLEERVVLRGPGGNMLPVFTHVPYDVRMRTKINIRFLNSLPDDQLGAVLAATQAPLKTDYYRAKVRELFQRAELRTEFHDAPGLLRALEDIRVRDAYYVDAMGGPDTIGGDEMDSLFDGPLLRVPEYQEWERVFVHLATVRLSTSSGCAATRHALLHDGFIEDWVYNPDYPTQGFVSNSLIRVKVYDVKFLADRGYDIMAEHVARTSETYGKVGGEEMVALRAAVATVAGASPFTPSPEHQARLDATRDACLSAIEASLAVDPRRHRFDPLPAMHAAQMELSKRFVAAIASGELTALTEGWPGPHDATFMAIFNQFIKLHAIADLGYNYLIVAYQAIINMCGYVDVCLHAVHHVIRYGISVAKYKPALAGAILDFATGMLEIKVALVYGMATEGVDFTMRDRPFHIRALVEKVAVVHEAVDDYFTGITGLGSLWQEHANASSGGVLHEPDVVLDQFAVAHDQALNIMLQLGASYKTPLSNPGLINDVMSAVYITKSTDPQLTFFDSAADPTAKASPAAGPKQVALLTESITDNMRLAYDLVVERPPTVTIPAPGYPKVDYGDAATKLLAKRKAAMGVKRAARAAPKRVGRMGGTAKMRTRAATDAAVPTPTAVSSAPGTKTPMSPFSGPTSVLNKRGDATSPGLLSTVLVPGYADMEEIGVPPVTPINPARVARARPVSTVPAPAAAPPPVPPSVAAANKGEASDEESD